MIPALVRELNNLTGNTIPQMQKDISVMNEKIVELDQKVDNQLITLNPDAVNPKKHIDVQDNISCTVIKELNAKKYK